MLETHAATRQPKLCVPRQLSCLKARANRATSSTGTARQMVPTSPVRQLIHWRSTLLSLRSVKKSATSIARSADRMPRLSVGPQAPAGGSDALWRRGARTREQSGRSCEQREKEAEEQGREQGRGEGTGGGAVDNARAGAGDSGLCRDDVATSDPGAHLVVHNNGAILHVHVRLVRGDLDGDAAANGARGSSRVDDVLPRIWGPGHEVVVVAGDFRSDAAVSDVHVDAASIGLVQNGIRGAIFVGTH
mmetsp:Transcript_86308/g.219834  ORF Transcript_86308/g.219834 Transcript_86308/m.219834 type:complete len:247 (-) Transcript_86308:701-1441(-)